MKENKMQLSPHFFSKEFKIDQKREYHGRVPRELLIALEFYREQLKAEAEQDLPQDIFNGIRITSFARTPYHNALVGGHKNSHHLYDYTTRKEPDAVDFTTASFNLYHHPDIITKMIEYMKTFNIFLSVGYYVKEQFIHINLVNSIHDMKRWKT